jgi:hypothetical protein
MSGYPVASIYLPNPGSFSGRSPNVNNASVHPNSTPRLSVARISASGITQPSETAVLKEQ